MSCSAATKSSQDAQPVANGCGTCVAVHVEHHRVSERWLTWAGHCAVTDPSARLRVECARQLPTHGPPLSTPWQLWLSRCQSGLSSCYKCSITPVSCMPMGCVPRGGDKPLGKEISPALYLTVLLLATAGFENSPAAQPCFHHSDFQGQPGASHQGVPQSCHEQKLLCVGWGGEPSFWFP